MKTLSQIVAHHKRIDKLFIILGLLSMFVGLMTLCALIINLSVDGFERLSVPFMTSFPSRFPEKAGILSSWVGSALVMLTTAVISIPIGVGAAIYLEEFAAKNKITDIIEINITNLAGVPSIVYGLMALGLFVYKFHLGQSVLTAGLTLGLLVLPIVITATREAIRAVPVGIREAAFALGATRWQMVKDHILPYSTGGISTGIIIALSRAIGESSPLITIGALTFIAFLPPSPITVSFPYISFEWLMSPFTVIPIQMFNWVSRPQAEFHLNAAAAGLILLLMTLSMNAVAIWIRYRFRKKVKW